MSHVIKKYDPNKYNFYRLLSDFFNVYHLTHLHFLNNSLCDAAPLDQSNEAETFFLWNDKHWNVSCMYMFLVNLKAQSYIGYGLSW